MFLDRFLNLKMNLQDAEEAEEHEPAQWMWRARTMIRKLKSGEYRLYSRNDPRTGKRRNLGTFPTLERAEKHERAVQFFKRRH
jgi:hypothetical protein